MGKDTTDKDGSASSSGVMGVTVEPKQLRTDMTDTVPTEDAPTETVPADEDEVEYPLYQTMSATMSQREVEVEIPLVQPTLPATDQTYNQPKGNAIAEADVASQVQSTSYGSVDLDPVQDVTEEDLETTALRPPAAEKADAQADEKAD